MNEENSRVPPPERILEIIRAKLEAYNTLLQQNANEEFVKSVANPENQNNSE